MNDSRKVALTPRHVSWDWSGLPMHFMGGDPMGTHIANGMNMLLPEGEVFFVQTFREALPLIKDDAVREDVIGFIGQEATHSSSHQSILDYLQEQGLDVTPCTEGFRRLFRQVLGRREFNDPKKARGWLTERVAMVAALEHFTSWLGDWGLNAQGWDRDLEPRVLDLFRWHLAEEVEHRHVAFDLFTHLDGSYWRRVRAWVAVSPVLALLWARGTAHLMSVDPELPPERRKARLRDVRRAYRSGYVFTPWDAVKMWVEFLRPSYHPRNYGSTSQAVAYLASSPAARAAV
ncbi:metal-dependent hydrolase [Mycobacterium colombiense]